MEVFLHETPEQDNMWSKAGFQCLWELVTSPWPEPSLPSPPGITPSIRYMPNPQEMNTDRADAEQEISPWHSKGPRRDQCVRACPKTRVRIVAAALFINKRSENPSSAHQEHRSRAGEESCSEWLLSKATQELLGHAARWAKNPDPAAPWEPAAKGHACQTDPLCLQAVPGTGDESQNGGHH